MEILSVALPPVEVKPAALFVALELSKSTWLVALHSPAADKVSQHRLEGGDAEGLLTLIGRRRAHAEAVLGRPVRVVSCYEAGYDGFWLHRLLCHRDIANRVLDAASILVPGSGPACNPRVGLRARRTSRAEPRGGNAP